MKCPIDGATLLMSDKKGVEIDYCPECRGVWLDRGELEKLIEQDANRPSFGRPQEGYDSGYEKRSRQYDDDYHSGHKKKKSSFLGEMFDF